MRSDIEIAQNTPGLPILRVADSLHPPEETVEPHGRHKASLTPRY